MVAHQKKIVSVDTVHLHDVADELTLNGRVTFNQEQVAHVYPMFGGTVTELRAEVAPPGKREPACNPGTKRV